jgi:GT2 family glycosyltransferase
MTDLKETAHAPEVCIIILNWNGINDTIECLESLRATTYRNYNVIVVDNGSEGNEAEILKHRYGDYASVIRNDRNCGFAEGNNIAIRYALEHSHPDYFLLLNNDTVVHPSFLDELIGAAEGAPSIGIVGPKVYFHGNRRFQAAGATVSLWTGQSSLTGYGQLDRGQYDVMRDVDWVIGCALLIKTNLIGTIGLLYSPYFALYEETEWCLRCKRAGYRVVYVPQAIIWHKGAQTTNKVGGFRAYYTGRNRFIFMRRNCSSLQFASFCVQFPFRYLFLTTGSLLISQRDVRSLIRYYSGIWDGIRFALSPRSGSGMGSTAAPRPPAP